MGIPSYAKLCYIQCFYCFSLLPQVIENDVEP